MAITQDMLPSPDEMAKLTEGAVDAARVMVGDTVESPQPQIGDKKDFDNFVGQGEMSDEEDPQHPLVKEQRDAVGLDVQSTPSQSQADADAALDKNTARAEEQQSIDTAVRTAEDKAATKAAMDDLGKTIEARDSEEPKK